MTYPEHDKLSRIANESQDIYDFLQWVRSERGWQLAEFLDDWHPTTGCLLPVKPSIRAILADYFDINEITLEREKVAMLNEQRRMLGQQR